MTDHRSLSVINPVGAVATLVRDGEDTLALRDAPGVLYLWGGAILTDADAEAAGWRVDGEVCPGELPHD